ncbi:uncharacterized protein LOC122251348 [Penaeus japonicus]|uniref:uncharacterized protein LOC122251348 n=1 Tax=Penaeus japonicus TaxID=27405 RepID=UPI001C70BCAA|nr:uncharacterized protein LOC122251348 [Penaeus japonicus]
MTRRRGHTSISLCLASFGNNRNSRLLASSRILTQPPQNQPANMPAIGNELSTFVSQFTNNLDLFKGQIRDTLTTLDITTIATVLLVVVGAVVIYDVFVYLLSSSSSKRSLMMSPVLAQLASNAWDMRDEFGFSNMIESRSFESLSPVLNAIKLAVEKYEHLQ